ncbi:MAG: acyl carrier protein [Neolewinella sp.]|jgi:acyl carrier protein
MMTSPANVQAPLSRSANLMQTLSTELRVPGHRLYDFTRLTEDLFLDPMDVQLLIASLESKLEFFLTEEEMARIETVGDIQHYFLR